MTQQELVTGTLDEPRDLAHPEPSHDLTPLMLIQRAVERGTDPAQLKALIDLQEQWRANRAREAFAAAMNAVQTELPCIVRDAHNQQTKSTYVRLETVAHSIKPVLSSNGFSLSFSEDQSDKPDFKRIVCLVRHSEGHSERHWIDLPLDGKGAKGNAIGAMNPVQAAISTGSYGQRVLMCRIFNLTVADSDLDGEAPNPTANPEAPKAQPRGQRQFAVTKEQMSHLAAHWKAKNPDPDGNLLRQSAALTAWLLEVAGRGTWNPRNQGEWKIDDYISGCKALNIEAEGLE